MTHDLPNDYAGLLTRREWMKSSADCRIPGTSAGGLDVAAAGAANDMSNRSSVSDIESRCEVFVGGLLSDQSITSTWSCTSRGLRERTKSCSIVFA
jgi:hypothetical protein